MIKYKLKILQIVILMLTMLVTVTVQGQYETTTPQNTYLRDKISLNGHYKYFVDRYESFFYDFVRQPFDDSQNPGIDFAALDKKPQSKSDRLEYNFDTSDSLSVPGDWNSQKDKLFYYEGSIWYRQLFETPKNSKGKSILLHFGAINYRADIYLNGKKVGVHEGGFTPFSFDITTLLNENDNALVIRVDNKRAKEAVPTDVTDWWNYGGITRDVSLIILPRNYIEQYTIQLKDIKSNIIQGHIEFKRGGSESIDLLCPELGIKQSGITDSNGVWKFSIKPSKKIEYWSDENPKLYQFTIKTSYESFEDRIGLRIIKTEGNKLLLNGKSIFLRGICAHEENSEKGGRAYSKEDALRLLTSAKELHANFMRLAHYPHNEYMVRMADSMGILLWEEIPVYWTIDWDNEKTFEIARNQLSELIERDKNRASVIIWSIANETPTTNNRLEFLKKLAKTTRSLDSTRLLSAALFKQNLGDGEYTISDPFMEYTDIVSFNQYLGWYEGLPNIINKANFKFNFQKPVFVSEFGAGAKAGFRGDSLTRWTEDYQDYLYKETLKLLDRMPNLVGFSPWILYDFRSPRRQLPNIQDEWNRKGVIGENGEKKLAYYTLQDYYKSIEKEKE